ncbi:telomeric repeat-binding factor 2-like isoform X3 [Ptychodera flava]|uniref:telomeric repeat-binding factor 2-like isoform X3 n=1 Tax=Ptychodera flava TaxID=63121 RepID=UPI003969F67D
MAPNNDVRTRGNVYTLFHRWHLEMAVQEYWEEFKEHCKVDRKTARDLYSGVIRAVDVSRDSEEFQMIKFLHLLSRLADGSDPNTEYVSTGGKEGTPLETSLGIMDTIIASTECLDDGDAKIARRLIRKQAVVVCCTSSTKGNYQKAEDVFHRLWNEDDNSPEEQATKKELEHLLTHKTGPEKQKILRHNSYARFHKDIVKFLENIHQQFKRPYLFDVAEQYLQREQIDDEETQIDEDVAMETEIGQGKDEPGGNKSGCDDDDDDDVADEEEDKMLKDGESDRRFETSSELKNCFEMVGGDEQGWDQITKFDARIIAELKSTVNGTTSKSRRPRKALVHRKQQSHVMKWNSLKTTAIPDNGDESMNNNNNLEKDQELYESRQRVPADGKRRRESGRPTSSGKERQSPKRKRHETSLGEPSSSGMLNGKLMGRSVDGSSGEDGAADSSLSPLRGAKRPLSKSHRLLGDRNEIRGEVVTWSDSDSDVPTPPRRIPSLPKFNKVDPCQTSHSGRKHSSHQHRRPWSQEEIYNLKQGVKRHGTGNWRTILNTYEFNNRTNVNLKDKWRVMERNGEV